MQRRACAVGQGGRQAHELEQGELGRRTPRLRERVGPELVSGGWGWAGVGGWGWGWAVVLGAGTGAETGAEAHLEHFHQPLCEGGRARPEILRLNRVPEELARQRFACS